MSFFAVRSFAPAGKGSIRVARGLFHRCSLFASRFQPSLLSLISGSASRRGRAPRLSQRYESGSTLVTSNLPFQEWTEVLGSERLTGALLDRLTRHVHILEMNGESYRLKQSKRKRGSQPNC
jgi:hypothetical protein